MDSKLYTKVASARNFSQIYRVSIFCKPDLILDIIETQYTSGIVYCFWHA